MTHGCVLAKRNVLRGQRVEEGISERGSAFMTMDPVSLGLWVGFSIMILGFSIMILGLWVGFSLMILHLRWERHTWEQKLNIYSFLWSAF